MSVCFELNDSCLVSISLIKWSAKSSLTRDQFVSQKLPESTPALISRSW